MSATKAVINVTSFTFASTAVTRISQCSFGYAGQLAEWSGDGDRFTTVLALVMQKPHCTVTSGDPYTLNTVCAPGLAGTVIATFKDAKAQTGGDLTFTMINGIVENYDVQQQHSQYGTATVSIKSFSTDGSTNPLSFAEA